MEKFNIKKIDWRITLGLGMIAASLMVFIFTEEMERSRDFFDDPLTGVFMLNYLIAIIYLPIAIFSHWRKVKKVGKHRFLTYCTISLSLFNISAYALNRTIPIFQLSADWLVIYLVIFNIALLIACFREYLPNWANHIILFLLTTGLIFQIYQWLVILPVIPIGLMAFFFFGISLHAFVPLSYVFILIAHISAYLKHLKRAWIAACSAIVIVITVVTGFTLSWVAINNDIIRFKHSTNFPGFESDLPDWVEISQRLPNNWITERALKSDLIYQVPENWGGSGLFLPNMNFQEPKKHDPLVMAACFFTQKIELSADERLKVLNAVYDIRHQSQDRLWNGQNLQTTDITTNIELFPKYRLSFTEKILTIHHDTEVRSWWSNEQEALYTFYLPEGATVTSLSLWINGKEAPGYLTTKSKADSAYNEIVGVEVRDPSVVHWQEGNTVFVRVFPCTPEEDRKFKVGITAPLRYTNGKLEYENIYFDGPDFREARESINVLSRDGEFESTLSFDKEEGDFYTYFGDYNPDWRLNVIAPNLAEEVFTFNGAFYKIGNYKAEFAPFEPEYIYLDINSTWTAGEFENIWELISDKKVYVANKGSSENVDNGLVAVNEHNAHNLFKSRKELRYNLFPFHKIKHPEKSLIITKPVNHTPTLKMLEGSGFANRLQQHFNKHQGSIKVFNFGEHTSLYHKTLKELRMINYAKGDMNLLSELITTKQFIKNQESENRVVIDRSQVVIDKVKNGKASEKAPDHLLRLFGYNDVLKKLGPDYFKGDDFIRDELIKEASEAYVVTPLSSMIVLETQEDYDRFGIDKAENSLDNAKINSSGAVPEPHEWALIILGILIGLFFIRKELKKKYDWQL